MSSEKWFDQYAESVYSYILLLVNNAHTAEDLLQETFLKVIAKEHQFKGNSSVKTWIFRIAYTTTMSYFRKNKTHLYFLNLNYLTTDSLEEIILRNSQQKQFYDTLKTLKPTYQQVIILREIHSFSTKETSAILKWSEGKVKMTLSRALLKFKSELIKGGLTSETIIRR